jgi:hypothetical protein
VKKYDEFIHGGIEGSFNWIRRKEVVYRWNSNKDIGY